MRKVSVLLVGLLVGAIVGAVGWQVGFAVEPQVDTLVVCERTGVDLRSPAANGTCPSGYTKKEITETLPNPVTVWTASGTANGLPIGSSSPVTIASISLAPGTYSVVATGNFSPNGGTDASITCDLDGFNGQLDRVNISRPADEKNLGDGTTPAAMSGVNTLSVADTISVRCFDAVGGDQDVRAVFWHLAVTRVDSLNPLP